MGWGDGFIAVDWGTTNRRAYALDAGGACTAEFEDDKGIMAVEPGGFPAAVAEIRARLGERPLLMAGMVGSDRGWRRAPYVACPAGFEELAAQLCWVAEGEAAIVPGLCYKSLRRADVMRGEELQIVGAAAAGLLPDEGLVCHPGTHNKWVETRSGRIEAFRTVMTGEVFNLLRKHSLLAPLLQGEAEDGVPFLAGVRHGLGSDDLLCELFGVRARILIDNGRPEEATSYISGLMIGSDLRVGLRGKADHEVVVIGRPELTRLYAAALHHAGRTAREIDGEQAFLAGAKAIAERLA